jgi:hypothetical protein
MVTTELIDTKKNKKNWVTSYNCMHIIQLSYLINLFFIWHGVLQVTNLSSVLLSTWTMNWLNFELSHQKEEEEDEEVIKHRPKGGVLVHGAWAGEAIRIVGSTS